MNDIEARKYYATPHLIASANIANEILSFMNADLTDLRHEVEELELAADLHHNLLLKQENKTIAVKESEYRISEPYKLWRKKKGMLSDIRAWRRSFERHCNLLVDQEKYKPKGYYERVI